jgi:ATP-dependent HslUV protease subunit HslV
MDQGGVVVAWFDRSERFRDNAGMARDRGSNGILPGATVRATTVLCIRHRGGVAMAGDGQVTLDRTVVKQGARKIRRLAGGTVLAGFAGTAADGFALLSRFETRLEEFPGNLERAAVELARDWRTDRTLRRLEALLIVASTARSFLLSGTGDLIEPDDGLLAVGSGGACALAAARALVRRTDLGAREIAEEAIRIAAGIDVYTNDQVVVEVL